MLCVQDWRFDDNRRSVDIAEFSKGLDGVRGLMAFGSSTHTDVGYDIATNSAADLPAARMAHMALLAFRCDLTPSTLVRALG